MRRKREKVDESKNVSWLCVCGLGKFFHCQAVKVEVSFGRTGMRLAEELSCLKELKKVKMGKMTG